VFTVRCTARLVKRLKVLPAPTRPEPTTRLGDWHANLVHVGRQQLVLAVSERTLLPVVVQAAPIPSLLPRMRVAIRDVLTMLGVTPDAIEREEVAMAEVAYAKATNRQVLGILVDFARVLPFHLEGDATLLGVSMKLAETPCSPLYKTSTSPDRATAALFGTRLVRVVG
jgi:hypothetical protein